MSDPFPGVPPKPPIWADPGPIVYKGSPVTIWCQGSLQADGYRLYKDRSSWPLDTRFPQASSNKSGFPIEFMSTYSVGRYQCEYFSSSGWSEQSDPLVLVMTGERVELSPLLSNKDDQSVASGRPHPQNPHLGRVG